ncbi:hypothetical protein QE152_g31996 [Popillia japonica]|uniref:Uncharacterized protein n=1 Tax=Popillia japonica TaxID=7064 RepID=A0AAW1J143_POPJA
MGYCGSPERERLLPTRYQTQLPSTLYSTHTPPQSKSPLLHEIDDSSSSDDDIPLANILQGCAPPGRMQPYQAALIKLAKTANRGKAAVLTSSSCRGKLSDSAEAKRSEVPTNNLMPLLKGKGSYH